jgi:UDP-glucuronate 4-epimerase
MKILVTGAAGFIGMHISKALVENRYHVIGIDNLNDYYDPQLKRDRLRELSALNGFRFVELDIANRDGVAKMFELEAPTHVINLAAQAGVRYSIENPHAYVDSNLIGFVNILEGCRQCKVEHLIYASSSSVYGLNDKVPFSTTDNVDYPISLYAATKKSNELMAHTYSHLFNIPCTGLRFFTVYGPWGRPDMAYYSFTKRISQGVAINVYNQGKMQRDFTYIDDVVNGIHSLLQKAPPPLASEISNSKAPYRVFNIGNTNPVSLERFINAIEKALGKKAVLNYLPMQPGDVPITYADVSDFTAVTGFKPTTEIEVGIEKFVNWFKQYHKETI